MKNIKLQNYKAVNQAKRDGAEIKHFSVAAMLMYRTCRCCRRIWNKLLHTVFHILAIPCIAIGFIAVLDSHNLRTVEGNPSPIPNFYSLHSWIGLAAMGLFALQVGLCTSTVFIHHF